MKLLTTAAEIALAVAAVPVLILWLAALCLIDLCRRRDVIDSPADPYGPAGYVVVNQGWPMGRTHCPDKCEAPTEMVIAGPWLLPATPDNVRLAKRWRAGAFMAGYANN